RPVPRHAGTRIDGAPHGDELGPSGAPAGEQLVGGERPAGVDGGILARRDGGEQPLGRRSERIGLRQREDRLAVEVPQVADLDADGPVRCRRRPIEIGQRARGDDAVEVGVLGGHVVAEGVHGASMPGRWRDEGNPARRVPLVVRCTAPVARPTRRRATSSPPSSWPPSSWPEPSWPWPSSPPPSWRVPSWRRSSWPRSSWPRSSWPRSSWPRSSWPRSWWPWPSWPQE